jgi:hypothetical protein
MFNENSRWDIQRSRIARIPPQPIPHRPPIALKEPNSALFSRRANHSQALVSANSKQRLIARLHAHQNSHCATCLRWRSLKCGFGGVGP